MKRLLLVVILCASGAFSQDRVIVVLGSSTAEGVGPKSKEDAWVSRYRHYLESSGLPVKLVNLAKSGYSTYNIMPTGYDPTPARPKPDPGRNITKALALDPAAIIINLPSNDAGKGHSVEEQIFNYDQILSLTHRKHIPTWITTTQPRNYRLPNRENLEAMRDSTLSKYGDVSIDFWSGIALSNGFISPEYDSGDGVHLNKAAHSIFFKRVRDAGVLKRILKRETR